MSVPRGAAVAAASQTHLPSPPPSLPPCLPRTPPAGLAVQALLALEREWQAWEWAEGNGPSGKAWWCDAWNSNIDLSVTWREGVVGMKGSGCDARFFLAVCKSNVGGDEGHQLFSSLPAARPPSHRPRLLCRDFRWWGLSGNLEMLGHFPRLQYVLYLPHPPPLSPTTDHGRDLRFTGFEGEIPASIGNATALQHLHQHRGTASLNLQSPHCTHLPDVTHMPLPPEWTQRQLLSCTRLPPSRTAVRGGPVRTCYQLTLILSITATYKTPVLQGPMADLSSLAPLTRLQHLYAPLPLPLHSSLSAFPSRSANT
ncbi:unnamed protein product [Closterium sp. NIES-65]|nr:unnamed protein product [Closterium sp. NIES-65]